MKNVSLPLKSITTLSLVFLLVAFVTCNKTETLDLKKQIEYSSVSVINGTYKIDSNIATANWNKEKLLAKLETENLIDKKTVAEIPDFIKAFLDSISSNKTFDLANPGEEWQEGGWVNGFDNQKKCIVNATSTVAKPFPTKQLVYFGIGKNMALISYYTGGIRMAQHMIIIKFENKKIVDLWFDNNWYDYNSDFVVAKKDSIIKCIKKISNQKC